MMTCAYHYCFLTHSGYIIFNPDKIKGDQTQTSYFMKDIWEQKKKKKSNILLYSKY